MSDPADDDDLEIVTDKKVEGEDPGDSTTDSKARPGDSLEQILTKPTMSVSCTLCMYVRDHLLGDGVGQEGIMQPPMQKTPQGP